MKKFTLAVAFACTAGLLAGCGGGSDDDAGAAPDATEEGAAETQSTLTKPIEKAESIAAEVGAKADEAEAAMGVAGDAVASATESRTVTLAIDGMS